jgi:energy-coupling factor transporter transmembrane protein EcfT
MLDQLELYVQAQRTIAHYMMGFGVILVLLAVLCHLTNANALFNGLKIGCLLFGVFSFVSGYAYQVTEEKLLDRQSKLYEQNPAEFLSLEKARMQKVVQGFARIQLVFGAIILLSLLVIFTIEHAFVSGLAFALILLLLGNMVIERVSKSSIDAYYEKLVSFK